MSLELPGKTRLTIEQQIHNFELDMKIRQSNHEFEMRELKAKADNLWFRENYPDAPESMKLTYGINVIGRKCVIGLRYIE